MRISDWSSDVCSSDLNAEIPIAPPSLFCTASTRPRNRNADMLSMTMPCSGCGPHRQNVSPSMDADFASSSWLHEMIFPPAAANHPKIIGVQSPSPSHRMRSEEQTSELQSLMRISYAACCLK